MIRVLFVPADAAGAEETAALRWLRGIGRYPVSIAAPDFLADAGRLRAVDALWLHAGSAAPRLSSSAVTAVRDWLSRGGGLLLTLLATPLASALGLESLPPNDERVFTWHDDADELWSADFRDWPAFPHVRGMQAWGAHPLFDGMGRGTYTWRAVEGERVAGATYVLPRWPERGGVVAVERAYVSLNAARAVAWEYQVGKGRVLCVGAHLHWAARSDTLAAQRDRVARNALDLLGRHGEAHGPWWPAPTTHSPAHRVPPPLPRRFGALLPEISSPIALSSLARDDDPFTLAGRRTLAVGGERSGLAEVWVHPLCVLSGGIRVLLDAAEPGVRTVTVAPEQVVRFLRAGLRFVEERLLVASRDPVATLEYRFRRLGSSAADVRPPTIELRLRLPLRLEWPIPPSALRPVHVRVSRSVGGAVVEVAGRDDAFVALLNVEGDARVHVDDDVEAPLVLISGELSEPLRLTWTASAAGPAAAQRTMQLLERAGLRALAVRRAERARVLREEHLRILTPSSSLDTALEWAKVRLDSFVATAPGVGTGLMAGYASTRPGWGESRPGYAWFFGRDACWSGLAMLGAGMFAEVGRALEFLAAWQDITGKIPHEVTTSGAAHYDAADSTPLWLVLLAAYVDWTGDLDSARALWPTARQALAFVHSTDRDDDGLPENTDVGHGWLESAPLGGGAVTSYVAALWVAALEGTARLAERLGEADLAREVAADAERARRALRTTLRDPASGRIALHRAAEGTLRADVTALSAVPVALGVLDEAGAARELDALETEELVAPWGVRLLSPEHELYDPAGYHGGAVWPLYTGWMSLAMFEGHRAERGYQLLAANAQLCYDRAKGAFDEVLRGDEPRAAGVCADQAWSAAMVVSPLVYGLLGARPDAPDRRLRLTPHWPREWTSASVRSLRVGDAQLDIDAVEGCLVNGAPHDGVRYRLRATPPGALTVVLEHPVGGRTFTRVLVGGVEPERVERCGTASCPHVRVAIRLGDPVEVQFVGDPIAIIDREAER